MSSPRKVLFLCSGNSCRSQMAEALVNAQIPGWMAFSAGVRPTGAVHPMAVSVLRELGIDHKGASKSVDEFRDHAFDVVVTVCDDASEACPVWLGTGIRKHHSFRDPARAEGTEQERREFFRLIRDEIVAALPALLD